MVFVTDFGVVEHQHKRITVYKQKTTHNINNKPNQFYIAYVQQSTAKYQRLNKIPWI